jgi:hypothetical protein
MLDAHARRGNLRLMVCRRAIPAIAIMAALALDPPHMGSLDIGRATR